MIRAFLVEAGHYLSNQEIQTLVQLPDGPNPLSVESYANRLGKGPSEDRPLFSWSHSVAHPWNIAVIRILTSKFRAYSIQNGLPKLLQLLNPSHRANTSTIDLDALVEFGDVEKLITEKIGYQQSRLRGAMRNIHSMQGKTGAEIGSALLSKSVAERTRACRNERRRNVSYMIYLLGIFTLRCPVIRSEGYYYRRTAATEVGFRALATNRPPFFSFWR